jgi:DNA-binding LacI/PurR family transcriptional regulator
LRRKGLTSLELAKMAGVSSATVSRAFTTESRIKPETRRRILELAETHGFRPNAMARSLNNRESRLVALVVNTVANPAEGEELNHLIHRLQDSERMPLVLCCGAHEDRMQLMRFASAYQVEHVILFSDMVSIDDALNIFRTSTLIVASEEPLSGRQLDAVSADSGNAAEEIVDHLVAQGRRRFAYLSGRYSSYIDKRRMRWFSEALKKNGLSIEFAAHGDYSYESGYKEAALFLRRAQPDVVICANDLMAVGVKDAAQLLGLRVPGDLAIVGHDDVGLAGWDCHSITSIALVRDERSQAFIDLIDGDPGAPPKQTVLQTSVRWRRSTGPLPSKRV